MTINFTDIDLENIEQSVLNDSKHGSKNKLITECQKKYSLNMDVDEVAMKICLIDVTDSTNLSRYKKYISVVDLANIIVGIKDIDNIIKQGDLKSKA